MVSIKYINVPIYLVEEYFDDGTMLLTPAGEDFVVSAIKYKRCSTCNCEIYLDELLDCHNLECNNGDIFHLNPDHPCEYVLRTREL